MKAKYKRGKRIKSVGDFEKSKSLWYRVQFGNKEKTMHRGFLENWQYHTLDMFIRRGWFFEALCADMERKEENEDTEDL